jgi:hypothetical protein
MCSRDFAVLSSRYFALPPLLLPGLNLSMFGRSFSKRDATLVVSYMDVMQIVIFLVCILWIRAKEKAAKLARVQVTAGSCCVKHTKAAVRCNCCFPPVRAWLCGLVQPLRERHLRVDRRNAQFRGICAFVLSLFDQQTTPLWSQTSQRT